MPAWRIVRPKVLCRTRAFREMSLGELLEKLLRDDHQNRRGSAFHPERHQDCRLENHGMICQTRQDKRHFYIQNT